MLRLADLNLGTRKSYTWSIVDKSGKEIYSGDYKGLIKFLFPDEFDAAYRTFFIRKKGYKILKEELAKKGMKLIVVDPATGKCPY